MDIKNSILEIFIQNNYIVSKSIIVTIFIFFFLIIIKRVGKRWRVKKSYKVIKKIKSFEGENIFPRTINYLRKIDPFVFEEVILSCLDIQNVKIKRNKRYTGDGGIDGRFFFKRKKYLVQAKRYKSHINKQHVLDFKNLCENQKKLGLFVHTGKTGKGSKLLFDKKVKVLSGEKLIKFIRNEYKISELLDEKN